MAAQRRRQVKADAHVSRTTSVLTPVVAAAEAPPGARVPRAAPPGAAPPRPALVAPARAVVAVTTVAVATWNTEHNNIS